MRWIIFYFLLLGANTMAQKLPCGEKLWKITVPLFPALFYTEEWKYQIYTQPNYKFMDYPYSTFNLFDSIELMIVLNELDTFHFPKVRYDHKSYQTDVPPYLCSALQIYIPKNQPNAAIIIQNFSCYDELTRDILPLKQSIGDSLRLKVWINKQPTLCRTFTDQKQIRLYPTLMTNPKNNDAYSFCGYLSLEKPCLDLDIELAYKKEYEAHMDAIPNKPLTDGGCTGISYDVIIEKP